MVGGECLLNSPCFIGLTVAKQKFGQAYPVLRRIARDYLAIPASSCLIERAFSMSALTDDPRRGSMGGGKFGALQRLRDAYRDGRLEAIREAWLQIDPDFSLDSSLHDF